MQAIDNENVVFPIYGESPYGFFIHRNWKWCALGRETQATPRMAEKFFRKSTKFKKLDRKQK